MAKQRNWYTYQFKRGNKVLHGGITQEPTRREEELQNQIDTNGHLKIIGKPKTEKGARNWETKHGYS